MQQRPATQEADDEIDLMALLGTLWRGKWIIAGCAALLMLIGGFYVFRVAVPKYQASTTLALELRGENVVDLESVVSGVSTETSAINTELEVIRSSGLLEKLVTDLSLNQDPEFNSALQPTPEFSVGKLKSMIRTAVSPAADVEEPGSRLSPEEAEMNRTVAAVRNAIAASNQRNTYIFQISATTQDEMKSALIANTLARLYIQDQIDVKFQATENAVAWLSERVIELEAELKERENAIKELRSETDLVNAEALQALNQQAKDVRDRLADSRTSAALVNARVANLRALQESDDLAAKAAAVDDPTLDRLVGRAATDSDTRELFEERFALLITREENALQRAEQQVAALEASYARLQEQIEQQSADLVKLQQLERETEATRTLYETFLTRLKETTVQRGLQQADSRVLSKATPGQYVEPRKSRILALCIILGGMIGAGIVLVRQMMHSGFRTPEDLEAATGHAVFGQIPKMPLRRRGSLIDYLNDKPTSAAAEAIRNLRTSVLLSDIDQAPQIIMSTSAVPGEGKTTQSISLSHNLAGLGKKVLLIEGDIRRRTFAEYFDFGASPGGLVTALTEGRPLSELVVRAPGMDVDVLRGEKASINAADLFSSDRFQEFLQELRQAYDYIVIDTPPVLVVPDARVIGQFVDAVIFSVAWDRTSKTQVTEALRQFQSVGIRVHGLVMAQIDPRGMKRYGYGGKYGAYSSYGKGYYDAS
ncbi:GumC family protein [Marinovum sp.]|uniref:GumC family protein n=1 Tax=Marinovum sp. TaxID=2024839 RepID=UPI002B277D5F|nr:polysaccharide biosynthesis tyrosine autokinase [Marinovum sp.]